MANWLQFATQEDFDAWLADCDANFGYPSPGVNAATGLVENAEWAPTLADPRGWTVTWAQNVDLKDGRWTGQEPEDFVRRDGELAVLTQEEFDALYAAAYPSEIL